jgi:hypothetical protein
MTDMTPKFVLLHGNAVALYHGRKQLGIWLLEQPATAELIEEVRNYNPNPEK